jgi:hypothetical protein
MLAPMPRNGIMLCTASPRSVTEPVSHGAIGSADLASKLVIVAAIRRHHLLASAAFRSGPRSHMRAAMIRAAIATGSSLWLDPQIMKAMLVLRALPICYRTLGYDAGRGRLRTALVEITTDLT